MPPSFACTPLSTRPGSPVNLMLPGFFDAARRAALIVRYVVNERADAAPRNDIGQGLRNIHGGSGCRAEHQALRMTHRLLLQLPKAHRSAAPSAMPRPGSATAARACALLSTACLSGASSASALPENTPDLEFRQ